MKIVKNKYGRESIQYCCTTSALRDMDFTVKYGEIRIVLSESPVHLNLTPPILYCPFCGEKTEVIE